MNDTHITALCGCGCGQPTPLAQRSDPRSGQVKGQPVRFLRGHNRRGAAVGAIAQRDPDLLAPSAPAELAPAPAVRDEQWYRNEIAELTATATHLEDRAAELRSMVKAEDLLVETFVTDSHGVRIKKVAANPAIALWEKADKAAAKMRASAKRREAELKALLAAQEKAANPMNDLLSRLRAAKGKQQ